MALSELGDTVTLEQLCLPLVNAEHKHRVSLFRNEKECGTTMPLVLYSAFKLKFLVQHGEKSDFPRSDDSVHESLRYLLSDIHATARAHELEEDVMVSKTFHEIIFQHIMNDKPFMVAGVGQLQLNVTRNKAHTVSGNNCPSCSIPGYVCQWLLEKNGLAPNSSYVDINSEVKRLAKSVYSPLEKYDRALWQPKASFSRRVQNQLFWKAFKTVFTASQLEIPLINPGIGSKSK